MSKKPNVIFFFSDQQRWDTIGCYGQELNITPNLDAIAKEGVRFENAFTCQPVCGPARSILQTGLYATETGCYRNDVALPEGVKTLPMHFKEQGYDVAYVGKWHLASDTEKGVDYQTTAIPLELRGGYDGYWMASDLLEFTSHGYDGYVFDKDNNRVDFKGYRVDCITDLALDFIKNRDKEKSFFLFLSHIEPHHQNDRNTYEGPDRSKEKFKEYNLPEDLRGEQGDFIENYPDYLGCCESLDKNVGRVIDELKKQGIYEDTVFFYTSDHGSHFRTRNKNLNGGYDDYKRSCHEGCLRIPMIARGPGFEGGKVIDELVSLINVPCTLLQAADINKPENMRGKPLQKLVDGSEKDWEKEVFVQISESWVGRAIRTDRWKYCVYAPDLDPWKVSSSDVYYEQYLYDLENDYIEKNNLVNDKNYEDIRKELAERLKKRIIQAGEKEPEILPAK